MGQTEPAGLVANEAAPARVDLERYSVDLSAGSLLPESVARRYHAVPLGRRFGAPVVAIADPTDLVALDDLRGMIGREFIPVVASPEQIEIFLSRCTRSPCPLSRSPRRKSTARSPTVPPRMPSLHRRSRRSNPRVRRST